MIQSKLTTATRAKIKTYPTNNLRASEIGHPCERYLVLSITNWQDKKPHEATLQNIFDLGNALETEAIRRLKESGLEILTARKNFRMDAPLITGREDVMIQDPESGELYPCEIKGLAPNSFNALDSVEDMRRSKRYYIRKYPAQLQIYMLHHEKEKGFFILFNKITGQIKVIDVALDYEYAEKLLKKAERIYIHISNKTLPDCIDDENICSDCPLLLICGARINRGEVHIDTGELEAMLLRRDELLPHIREMDSIKFGIKQAMRGCDKAFTESYFVQKKTVERKPFVVAGSVYTKEVVRRIKK